MNKSDDNPFKNNPAMWMLVSVPLTSVIVGLTFLAISIKEFDGVVADDYYKRGKLINQTLERDQYAKDLYLTAKIDLNHHNDNEVQIFLSGENGFEYPDNVQLNIIHRTRAGKDQQLLLHHLGSGKYSGLMKEELTPSRWLLQISTSDWRLNGEFIWPQQKTFAVDNN